MKSVIDYHLTLQIKAFIFEIQAGTTQSRTWNRTCSVSGPSAQVYGKSHRGPMDCLWNGPVILHNECLGAPRLQIVKSWINELRIPWKQRQHAEFRMKRKWTHWQQKTLAYTLWRRSARWSTGNTRCIDRDSDWYVFGVNPYSHSQKKESGLLDTAWPGAPFLIWKRQRRARVSTETFNQSTKDSNWLTDRLHSRRLASLSEDSLAAATGVCIGRFNVSSDVKCDVHSVSKHRQLETNRIIPPLA